MSNNLPYKVSEIPAEPKNKSYKVTAIALIVATLLMSAIFMFWELRKTPTMPVQETVVTTTTPTPAPCPAQTGEQPQPQAHFAPVTQSTTETTNDHTEVLLLYGSFALVVTLVLVGSFGLLISAQKAEAQTAAEIRKVRLELFKAAEFDAIAAAKAAEAAAAKAAEEAAKVAKAEDTTAKDTAKKQ